MAFMNQEKKAKIAAALKLVVPQGWKYSLRVDNYSSIQMTIVSAPVDLIAHWNRVTAEKSAHREPHMRARTVTDGYVQVNEYYLDTQFDGEVLAVMEKIKQALNTDNHDNSDIQTDYFDVGHYVHLQIGKWNKPFVVKA